MNRKSEGSIRTIYFIAAGDISFSGGSRTLFKEMVASFSRTGFKVHSCFYQIRLEDVPQAKPDGTVDINDYPYSVFSPTSKKLFCLLPRPLFRLYERIVIGFFFLHCLKKAEPEDLLIVQGCLGVMHLLPIRKEKRNIWWYKVGVIEEEVSSGIVFRFRKWVERLNATRLGKRMAVSKPMADFIEKSYGASDKETFILPCLVNRENFEFNLVSREGRRREMGCEGKLVVLYLGSAEPQQSPVQMIEFFLCLKEKFPNAYLWIVSQDKHYYEKIVIEKGIPSSSYRLESMNHGQLRDHLPAADIALLMRPKGLINRVSSPVKFPEYLLNGLGVIIGPEVGDYTEAVRRENVGVVVDPDRPEDWDVCLDEIKVLLKDRIGLRDRCLAVGSKYSWQASEEMIWNEFAKNDE